MFASLRILCAAVVLTVSTVAVASELKGDYLETRTCDVYTGPCFANGQGGVTGKDAIMAWSIDRGTYEGVDLAGLKVVVVINASDTLGFGGTLISHPDPIRSVIIVDQLATPQQREALVQFATVNAKHSGEVVKVLSAPIEMIARPLRHRGQAEGRQVCRDHHAASWAPAIAFARTNRRFIRRCATCATPCRPLPSRANTAAPDWAPAGRTITRAARSWPASRTSATPHSTPWRVYQPEAQARERNNTHAATSLACASGECSNARCKNSSH